VQGECPHRNRIRPEGRVGSYQLNLRVLFKAVAVAGIACMLARCGGVGGATVEPASPNAAPQASELTTSPTSLSFGNVTLGSSSSLPVVVTNTGTIAITISQAITTGAGFSVSGPALPLSVAAGQNTSFTVIFDPAAGGNVTGNLSVASTASNSPAIVSLAATGAKQHSVTLTWATSTSSNITGYNVYRGATSGGPYTKLNSSLLPATTYTDSAVEAGQTYYYVTTAVNSLGIESTDSNQATAVIPSP
jgi:hypothetical protein